MEVYPTTPVPRFDSERGKRLPSIRSESEGGYGMTRKQFTKNRPFFNLEYENITLDEYLTLEDFFLNNQGTVFTFAHPLYPLETYNVMFNMDDISAKDKDKGLCSTSIKLIGV